MTDNLIEAYKALASAQAEMTGARKSSKNPHFKSSYADLGDVQDACVDALHRNGFAVFQPTGQDEMGMYVMTIFAHESGAALECRTPLLVGKNDMQGLGSAITYARRYGLLCMSGVAPEDDDGNASVNQSRNSRETIAADAKKISESNVKLETATCAKTLDQIRKEVIADWDGAPPQEVVATFQSMRQRIMAEQEGAA